MLPAVAGVLVAVLSGYVGVLVAVALDWVWEETAAAVVSADVLTGAVVEFYKTELAKDRDTEVPYASTHVHTVVKGA